MDQETARSFRVVVNDEEQYSIWPAERELPPGWDDAGVAGPKEACLDHVRQVWTDMRPKSLRDRPAPAAPNPSPSPSPTAGRPRRPARAKPATPKR